MVLAIQQEKIKHMDKIMLIMQDTEHQKCT
jgi:hypothetical protein